MKKTMILAFDSFKGCLSARQACEIAAAAMAEAHPGWNFILKPLADGGEGTAEAMISSLGGEWIPVEATSPLPTRKVQAGFAWFASKQTALVEMASASGLPLLQPAERNPLLTTTLGTGELIAEAIRHGARHLILAVGGSATVDGGLGTATALGWQFLDSSGVPLPPGGGALARLDRIIPPPAPLPCELQVLCDVTNPLTGPRGAVAVYAPQKGATPAMMDALEKGLVHLARTVREQLRMEIETVPGAGAAGGLAAGALAFLGGRLAPGIQTVMETCELSAALREADWIITGEGRLDEQSVQGKVVSGVLEAAAPHRVPVGVIAGDVLLDRHEWEKAGIRGVEKLIRPGMSVEQSMQQAAPLLAEAARRFCANWMA